ncbi:glycosyltransferase [Octadecabacter sp.]|nr:glycosyltransferase [Octadecabacter sp.]
MPKLFVTSMFPDDHAVAFGTFVKAHFDELEGFKLIYPGNILRNKSKFRFYVALHLMFLRNLRIGTQVILHYPLYFPMLYFLCFITRSEIITVIHGGELMRRPEDIKIQKMFKSLSQTIHLTLSKYVFVPTNYVKDRYYAGSDKVQVWFSGGVEQSISLTNIKQSGRDIDILFVGRVHPVKGIDQVDDIINFNGSQNIKKTICVVGPGFSEYFSSYNDDFLEVYDSLEPKSVRELMHRSKLVVVPSLNESFCLVAVEAYLSGCNLLLNKLPALFEVFMGFPSVMFEERGYEFTKSALALKPADISSSDQQNLYDKVSRKKMIKRFNQCLL